jgi:hypothetical protein
MAIGSFAHAALVDLEPLDIPRMLTLDETLFVEHKGGVDEKSAHGLMSAVSSFANGLGGWVLLGVEKGEPVKESPKWLSGSAPPLIDVVRDRLRVELDPLPAFEARAIHCPGTDRKVGVVRVYESSDTPHIAIRTGAVYVREVAGVRDASSPGSPGAGRQGERIYRARQIGSRAQLVELAKRGEVARDRVLRLVDPAHQLPLVANSLPVKFEPIARGGFQPVPETGPSIVVRLVPYTLPPRFRGWATTADCAAALLRGVEILADKSGLDSNWAEPDPSGASVAVQLDQGSIHVDAVGFGLPATARLVADSAGVVGAALGLGAPENEGRRAVIRLDALGDLIRSVVEVAASVLEAGEFLGRAHCQIDLQQIPSVFSLEGGAGRSGRFWVPTSSDLIVPAEREEVTMVVQRSANALARSAGIPAWDEPLGAH